MKTVSMSGSLRENVGKKDAKKQRSEGNVPCVLYGGEKQIHFSLPEKSFKDVIFTPNTYIINLNIAGKNYNSVLKDVQYHPVTDHILHVDFLEIFDNKSVAISVPINLTGTSKGVLRGGKLVRKYRKLKVKGLPKYLPDEIQVDITNLNINESIKVMDLKTENIEFLDPPSSIIAAVKSARAVAEEEEPAAEPKAPAENA
ncbi:MAG TPA: 50S ribosomal protein L25/general stress protein Ctc [Bacteroidales bacterium]|nr:50S ribosomal protein L25/general stress protein Ctc [Bacteroidales bacterium]